MFEFFARRYYIAIVIFIHHQNDYVMNEQNYVMYEQMDHMDYLIEQWLRENIDD